MSPGNGSRNRIPKSFKLAGLEITSRVNNEILKDNKIGGALYHRQEIIHVDQGVPIETIEQAYVHEVVHWILFIMNNKLINDEEFVDLFAHLLYQALTTMEKKE